MVRKHDEIHFNSIATVQMSNVARYVKGNRSATLRLQRNTLIPCTPQESPSSFPASGNRTLRLSLGNQIGEGGCGLIYEATDVSLSGHSHQSLPPLVVKICKNFQHYKLPTEAAVYEEIHSLHGVITARYYGCFETVLRPGVTFPIWNRTGGTYEPGATDIDYPNISRVLSIIVMERLGDQRLPHRAQADDENLQRDLYQIVSDLSETAVEHGDFRWPNIVSAPEAPPGVPGRRCPKHGVRHKWRIIDFELSRKIGSPLWRIRSGYKLMAKELLRGLARGDYL